MLTLTGTPHNRGCQHGEARRDAIRSRVETAVHAAAGRLLGSGDDGLDAFAAPWEREIRRAAPGVADEIHGIAKASGSRVSEIVLLNAFEAFEVAMQVELGGCTAVALPLPGGAVVGQNWDANPDLAASVEIQIHRRTDGPALAMLASPGGLGWIGLNDRGLGLVTNDLLTPGRRIGVPSQVIRRLVLDEADVSEAVGVLRRHPAVGGRAYVLGDADGGVASVELAAELGEAAVADNRTPIVHTNHALDARVATWQEDDLVDSIYPSTWHRFARAGSMVGTGADRAIEDLRVLLADHEGYPGSVCRHETADEPTATAASVVFDCGRRVAEFAIGSPCTNQYVAVAL